MKHVICLIILGFFSFIDSASAASEYQPAQGEKVPEGEVKCEWSKLNSQQYRQCQARRKYYENLTPEQKIEQNKAARGSCAGQAASTIEDKGWKGGDGRKPGK